MLNIAVIKYYHYYRKMLPECGHGFSNWALNYMNFYGPSKTHNWPSKPFWLANRRPDDSFELYKRVRKLPGPSYDNNFYPTVYIARHLYIPKEFRAPFVSTWKFHNKLTQ